MHKQSKLETQSNALHAARSKAIDAFAELELACGFLMNCAAIDANGCTLGTKIAALVSIDSSSAFPIERSEKIRLLLTRFPQLLDIRNSIVHAPMKVTRSSDGCSDAAFHNQKPMSDGSFIVVKLQVAGLELVADLVSELAKNLTDPQICKPISARQGSIWQLIEASQLKSASH